ncbi:MAG: DinB family protein [Bryobacteraceae bacterium]
MPVLFSFQQVREDLERHTRGISDSDVWAQTPGGTLGFHLKHIAGSVDRISTYLIGGTLTEEQLQQLSAESDGGGSVGELLQQVFAKLRTAEERLRQVDSAQLFDFRGVGRKALPSTVIGLLVHLAEHTQRHLGQAITLARVVRSSTVHVSEPADEQ